MHHVKEFETECCLLIYGDQPQSTIGFDSRRSEERNGKSNNINHLLTRKNDFGRDFVPNSHAKPANGSNKLCRPERRMKHG